jgi:XTP/dITP diphosphohydrolase
VSGGPRRLRLVVATANPGKAREMREILEAELGSEVELVARPPDLPEVEEDGETLEDNARLKAGAVRSATGLPAVADDTGLEVDALGGGPGVRSARYAGPEQRTADNIAKLLDELAGREDRRARFHTVALVLLPDGVELVAAGTLEGAIAESPRGTRGFGYDAVFVPDGAGGRTLAEMTADEKHEISHRGRALRALARRIEAHLSTATSAPDVA